MALGVVEPAFEQRERLGRLGEVAGRMRLALRLGIGTVLAHTQLLVNGHHIVLGHLFSPS